LIGVRKLGNGRLKSSQKDTKKPATGTSVRLTANDKEVIPQNILTIKTVSFYEDDMKTFILGYFNIFEGYMPCKTL
jgi:hypothetical protein